MMLSPTRAAERRLIEASPLPIPAALLAGLVALKTASAVLALLAG